jgi:hypothetical protein
MPLEDLLAGQELPLDRSSSLAVFGSGFEDTALAVKELRRRGYREVLPLSGKEHGGYAWLAYADLI